MQSPSHQVMNDSQNVSASTIASICRIAVLIRAAGNVAQRPPSSRNAAIPGADVRGLGKPISLLIRKAPSQLRKALLRPIPANRKKLPGDDVKRVLS